MVRRVLSRSRLALLMSHLVLVFSMTSLGAEAPTGAEEKSLAPAIPAAVFEVLKSGRSGQSVPSGPSDGTQEESPAPDRMQPRSALPGPADVEPAPPGAAEPQSEDAPEIHGATLTPHETPSLDLELPAPDSAESTSTILASIELLPAEPTEPENGETAGSEAHRDEEDHADSSIAGESAEFPIEEIVPSDVPFKKVYDLFADGNWATALTRGLDYLDERPDGDERREMLYLLAEAAYQLGRSQGEHSYQDRINFYQQALRQGEQGKLGTFGRWRMGSLYLEAGNPVEAIFHLGRALRGAGKSSKRPVEFELVRAYTLTNRPEEAMTVLRALEDDGGDAQSELRIAELKGMILQSLGRDQDAWEAYQRATEIDPLWWRRDAGRAESYARAADKTGEMAQAERAYFFAVHSFEEEVWTMPGMFLSYADLLRHLGDGARRRGMTDEALAFDRDARHWYRRILGLLGEESSESAVRSEAQRRLRQYYGAEIASGKASLGLFHMSRGEVIQAMAQLQGAYEENVLSGAGSASVREAVNEIVEPYMSWAVRQGLWHEVIGAWELFGRELQEGHARNAALSYLATSLFSVGLDARSLLIIEDLLQKEEGSGIPTKDLLRVRRAEILSRLGRGEEVVGPLEELTKRDSITNVRTDALRVLAGVYADMGRNLEAAQALEELASGSDLTADERGNVWARAGNIYLEESMTDHAIEIGLRALILEDEHQGNSSSPLWDVAVGNRLRLMLGRAFYEQGDFERASITLRDYLERDGLHPGEKGMGGYLLGASQRLRGEVADARTTLENAQSDFSIPEIWRKASSQALATLLWEEARKN